MATKLWKDENFEFFQAEDVQGALASGWTPEKEEKKPAAKKPEAKKSSK